MFTFAVFGDRTGGPAEGVNVLADAVRDVNLVEPDMVMTLGDLIEGYATAEPWLQEAEEYKGIMNNLICPWFPVAGNHDIYWGGHGRPEGHHESNFETHFGPLWYAFEHKNCFFIVLYTDEGIAETNEKGFMNPALQQMSAEQMAWLKEMLIQGESADHVFVFAHHPRWIGGHYRDTWEPVHEVLKAAENVTAVFGGHIHHMRSDPRDGIQYLSLATVGGTNSETFPSAGYLHQYHLVTVRKQQIAVTSYPVGAAMDVLDITPDLHQELKKVSGSKLRLSDDIEIGSDGAVDQEVEVSFTNPSKYPIRIELTPIVTDSRWRVYPDHLHRSIAPGEECRVPFLFQRRQGTADIDFQALSLSLVAECRTSTSRYPIPAQRTWIPYSFAEMPAIEQDGALDLSGISQFLRIPHEQVPQLGDQFTVECWVKARSFPNTGGMKGRTPLITKAYFGEFGLFADGGRPSFELPAWKNELIVHANEPMLKANQWHHIAGVLDGDTAQLFVDGKKVGSGKIEWQRKPNNLDLLIGALPHRHPPRHYSHFNGLIDSVRLSTVARYSEDFTPEQGWESDDATALLYHMDRLLGEQIYDHSANRIHAQVEGGPTIRPRR